MPGLSRVLSKLGFCSRSAGALLARAGRVQVNGVVRRDPEFAVNPARDVLMVDGEPVTTEPKVYLMLNKPRGLVTTRADEKGRDTVFQCLEEVRAPHLSPVGRLDQASEGLLLFTNDTAWANQITDPNSRLHKTYHVQINRLADEALLEQLRQGISTEEGLLCARKASILRQGEKKAWLEIALGEGKNRHIRRMIEALDMQVLRLVRVAIGRLPLGELEKGAWRPLTPKEVAMLSSKRAP
jgi:23S rRNA pseudouridine2605 synthase